MEGFKDGYPTHLADSFERLLIVKRGPAAANGCPVSHPFGLPSMIRNCTLLIMSPEIDVKVFAFKNEYSSNSR